jgi:DNA-binding CsgD family transcriptional regulator
LKVWLDADRGRTLFYVCYGISDDWIADILGGSEMCHKPTYAVQQTVSLFHHLVGAAAQAEIRIKWVRTYFGRIMRYLNAHASRLCAAICRVMPPRSQGSMASLRRSL